MDFLSFNTFIIWYVISEWSLTRDMISLGATCGKDNGSCFVSLFFTFPMKAKSSVVVVLKRGCRLDVMHEKRGTWGLVPRKTRSQERVQRMGKAIAQAEKKKLDEEMERKHQRKPWRKQFSFPHVSLVETMSSNFNLGRAIASVMLPAFFYLVGWPMNSTLMWSHLEDGHLFGGSFLLDQSGGDMKFMKFMDANGAKIEFLISEKSDFDLKVGFFF